MISVHNDANYRKDSLTRYNDSWMHSWAHVLPIIRAILMIAILEKLGHFYFLSVVLALRMIYVSLSFFYGGR